MKVSGKYVLTFPGCANIRVTPPYSLIISYHVIFLIPCFRECKLSGCHCVVSLLVFDMAFYVCDQIDVLNPTTWYFLNPSIIRVTITTFHTFQDFVPDLTTVSIYDHMGVKMRIEIIFVYFLYIDEINFLFVIGN